MVLFDRTMDDRIMTVVLRMPKKCTPMVLLDRTIVHRFMTMV
jgi:hypothetical protein